MLTTIILIIIFFVLMLLLGSGLWATAWPWAHFERDYPSESDLDGERDGGNDDFLL